MDFPDLTFDLIAVQALNGAVLGTFGTDIPAGEAMGAWQTACAGHHGPGVVFILVPTTEPLYQIRRERDLDHFERGPIRSLLEAYARVDEAAAALRGQASRPAARAALLRVAAAALRAIEDLGL